MWLSLITGILKLVNSLTSFLERRELVNLGKSAAIKDGLERTLENMEMADEAADAVIHDDNYAERVQTRTEILRQRVLRDRQANSNDRKR